MLELIKDKVEECENIYKMIGILALVHALILFVMGIVSGPFSNIGDTFNGLANASSGRIMFFKIIETIYAIGYLIPIFMAFFHDLFFEEKPIHLLITILLELVIFSVLKIFQSLGGNLILFIGIGIVLCFLIGGSAFGIIFAFDYIITAGSMFLIPILNLIAPIFALGIIVTTLADFFA